MYYSVNVFLSSSKTTLFKLSERPNNQRVNILSSVGYWTIQNPNIISLNASEFPEIRNKFVFFFEATLFLYYMCFISIITFSSSPSVNLSSWWWWWHDASNMSELIRCSIIRGKIIINSFYSISEWSELERSHVNGRI